MRCSTLLAALLPALATASSDFLIPRTALASLAAPNSSPAPTATTPVALRPPSEQDPRRLEARQATSSSATDSAASTSGSSVSIPASAEDGGISYTTPESTASASYYKIYSGVTITWGWTLTSLYVTPTSLTFEARCSANSNTYQIGSVAGTATAIEWSPWDYSQSDGAVALAQASYTLRVADERGYDADASAGYLYCAGTTVEFAMYSPASYTSLADGWTCTTCSLAAAMASPLFVAVPVTLAAMLIGGAGVFA